MKTNGTVTRAHHQHLTTAIEFAAKVGTAERPRGSDREVDRDFSIAGMRVNVGRETLRKAQSDRAVARVDPPRGSHLRTRAGFGFDAAVAGLQTQPVPSARGANTAVACLGF